MAVALPTEKHFTRTVPAQHTVRDEKRAHTIQWIDEMIECSKWKCNNDDDEALPLDSTTQPNSMHNKLFPFHKQIFLHLSPRLDLWRLHSFEAEQTNWLIMDVSNQNFERKQIHFGYKCNAQQQP